MPSPQRTSQLARRFGIALIGISFLVLLYLSFTTYTSAWQGQSYLGAREINLMEDEACRLVHKSDNQCAFIKTHCPDEEAGLLSYLTLYYCRLNHAKPLAFTFILLWGLYLFSTIGFAASEFFTPNLSTISKALGMSESLSGVTLLALGNGSPDVFSTFAAVKSHSGSLALGELIGAAGFITAVVAGSMAIIKPFKVYEKTFVRDIIFFIIAVSFTMVFLANGSLALHESLVMVGFYFFYVAAVCYWHWWFNRRRQKRQRDVAARSHYNYTDGQVMSPEEYHDNEDDAGPKNISVEDFDALERADAKFDELDAEEAREEYMGALSREMRLSRHPNRDRALSNAAIRPSLFGAIDYRAALSRSRGSGSYASKAVGLRRYSDNPSFTLLQPEQLQSTSSIPQATPTRSAAEARRDPNDGAVTGSRIRAVSTNDAAEPLPDTVMLQRPLIPNVNVSVTPPTRSGDELPMDEETSTRGSSPQLRALSPFAPLSPPHSDRNTEEPGNKFSRIRLDTQNFLAVPVHPPAGSQHQDRSVRNFSRQSSDSSSSVRRKIRPQLKVSPPTSSRSSPRIWPKDSPISPYSDEATSFRKIPRPPSIGLLSPSRTPDSYFPADAYTKAQEKRWKWWPYRMLPPPEVVACTLFPALSQWSERNALQRCTALITAPSMFILTITLPVVELSDDKVTESSSPLPPGHHGVSPLQAGKANGADYLVTTSDLSGEAEALQVESGKRSTLETEDRPTPHPIGHGLAVPAAKEWNRWLVILQCFTAPYMIVLVTWANGYCSLLQPSLYSLLASLVALALILLTSTTDRPPSWHLFLCFVGFAVSIAWISTIANEMVGVLKTIGVILNWSDAILGLTLFAVGNSLGDWVADMTVARLGHSMMALSACFGGPMLNILLGIGLSSGYMVFTGAEKRHHKHPGQPIKYIPYRVEVDRTLLVSALVLLLTLGGLLLVVPLNGWKMDRKIGIGLVVLWSIGTVINVVIEVKGWGGDLTDVFT